MSRRTHAQLEVIKNKYNCHTLWSWSKYEKSQSDLYSFYLKYVKREPEDLFNSIYGVMGGECHDTCQSYYESKIKYGDMINIFRDKYAELDLLGYVFDRTNKEKNEKIKKNYMECLDLFFQNHVPICEKVACEKYMLTKIGNYLFQGYIDAAHKIGNTFFITDWKTSTIYKSDELKKKGGQLLIYAIALINKGVNPQCIKIRWNFMKYVNVMVPQANGKTVRRIIERNQLGSKLVSNVKMWLKKSKFFSDLEINQYCNELIMTNDLKCLPKNIQINYNIEDCYVYVDFDMNTIKEFEKEVIRNLDNINKKIKEYEKSKDDMIFYSEVTDKDSYFHANLSGYSAKLHKPYADYLDKYNDKKNDDFDYEEEDWMKELF